MKQDKLRKIKEKITKLQTIIESQLKQSGENLLTESSLSRIHQLLTNPNNTVGVMSSYITTQNPDEYYKINKTRHLTLTQKLRNMNLGYIELNGSYKYSDEYGGDVKIEKSLMIPNIKKKDLIELMNEYGQDSVIYKDKNEFSLIGHDGSSWMSFKTNKDDKNFLELDKNKIQDIFSKLAKGSHKNKKFVFKEK